MTSFPASDADRDGAAGKLADATADLPALPVRKSGLYRSVDEHQCVVIGGSVQRTGRFTIGRFCTVTAAFGQVNLDLRAAAPTQREIEVAIWSVASRVSLTVPHWWGLSSKVFVIGMSQTIPDREAGPGEHLLRLLGARIGGSLRVTEA